MMLSAKSASLIAGVLQQTTLVLIIRYSKTTNSDRDPYLTSVVIASSEVFKLLLSCILEVITNRGTTNPICNSGIAYDVVNEDESEHESGAEFKMNSTPWGTFKRMLRLNTLESAKLIVPAALYMAQNNLLFLALTNLSVPVYQVTNQGKLLTTAIISRIMLKRQINWMQYLAITLLGLGVAVTHLAEYRSTTNSENEENQKQWLGLLAVLISCCTSAFAGVYFELLLKTNTEEKHSVHHRNFQLAFWSFLMVVIQILYYDMAKVKKHGLFYGFDVVVVVIVVAQGMTGFVVSMILHYADSILKGFTTSAATVLATLVSIFVFDTKVNVAFFVGAFMVGVAIKIYSYYDKKDFNEEYHFKSLLSWKGWGKKCVLLFLVFCSIYSIGFSFNMLQPIIQEMRQDQKPDEGMLRKQHD